MDSAFDHPLVSERYFFPRPEVPERVTEVRAADGSTLTCRHTVRDPDALTVVYFHGNGEVVADYVPEFEPALLQMGVNVMFAEYRGYGGSTGRPMLASMLDDVEAIVDATGAPTDRIVAFGRSIGSIYAIELVSRFDDAAGLILESGIADPLERVLMRAEPAELGVTIDDLRDEAAEHFDHEAKLGDYEGPALVMHARHDDLVPPSNAQRNHGWLGSEDKMLLVFDHGDHNSILAMNAAEYLSAVASFLRSVSDQLA